MEGRVAGHRPLMEKKKCSYFWEPVLLHPCTLLGNEIEYPKVEATKESTKAATVSITGENGRRVEGGGKKEGYLISLTAS